MRLAARDEALREAMDDPACDPERLRRTLARFPVVNATVARWGRVYARLVRPARASAAGPVRILDIGCGGGDVLRRLVARARRDGIAAEGVGIDPDPRAVAFAREAGSRHVEFRRAHSRDLVAAGERYDVVVSNHLLHHLAAGELGALLDDSAALATRLSAHSDIARGRLAAAAFSAASLPLAPGSFVRSDGLRSIRRSYTAAELAARLPAGWRVERPGAFRLLATRRA